MKKNLFAIFMWLVVIVFVGVGSFLFSNSRAASDNDNLAILAEVDKLEGYASDYILETGSALDSTTLTLDYLRSLRYDDEQWNKLLGVPDVNFTTYVTNKGGIAIDPYAYLVDEDTYKRTDFIHMIAVLACYHKYGDTVSLGGVLSVSTDYSGWAGDLLTLMSEVFAYRTTNSITDEAILTDYTRSLLGTNKSSGFDTEDIYGDLDAINIYRTDDFDLTDLDKALLNYYVDKKYDVNYTNRVESSKTYLGSDESTIKTKANTLLSNTIVQNALTPSLAGQFTSLDYSVASQAFADYILQKPYLEITSDSGTGVVGEEDIKVQLYESNLGVPVISMTKDICDVEVLNDLVYIKPTNAGTTTITISTFNNKKSVQYVLTATNVAPVITKQMDAEYTLSSGVESSITIAATGTNNTYTWYISDVIDKDYKKLAVTAVPTYKFKPTMDMDKKYIKCVISNEGNPSAESTPALINVKNVTSGDAVSTGDKTLLIAISLIFLVVCANVLVLVIKKVKK